MTVDDTVAELRAALRRVAIKSRNVRRGNGWVPNGGLCEVCKAEWPAGWPERHAASCLLGDSK